MQVLFCLLLGYLVGVLNPAALLSRLKKAEFRRRGTGNYGATNTLLLLGKGWGVFVMVFDIAKAFLASRAAAQFFPELELAGLLAGCGAVLGHIFPFYLKFRGGKGLAAFGGMVLAYDHWMFLALLVLGILLMFLLDYAVAMPASASLLFPVFTGLRSHALAATLLAGCMGLLVFGKNYGNVKKARRGEEVKLRDFFRGKAARDTTRTP
ncbi:MAG: glycerol-3-phosphate acyltransferase [Clostridia bacterium]|nr:glycerol-3-phosphate acyltransferase [Clostridia bacterium]